MQPLDQAALQGMAIAVHALERPDDLAVVSHYGDRSFKELNANANRLVRLLSSAGLRPGDSIAVLSKTDRSFWKRFLPLCVTAFDLHPSISI